ncbi:uncharacterized protein J4E79_009586 [Alternaria viburni]|uniref:uncharacterized protein n=1 Tax=Alternaria viburni TaxID=566460 RepID=UPI0020C4AEB9|nr:uncharacterized protein J4E79_009586 [Alternaria viburni]KAI4650317.1 hypothetical protein J4E79_009586 [Alternaria viburni]
MSQSPGRARAPAGLPIHAPSSNAHPPSSSNDDHDNAPLPSYLARHIQLGFSTDDVAALITAIDSSQDRSTSTSDRTLAHLPAELLLQILEHVPVDYILDWRLVCRGFRDAIDGRVLYRCLQRTELVGYMGARDFGLMVDLDDEQYESVHLLEAGFSHVEWDTASDPETNRPAWSATHAVFEIAEEWYDAFRHVGGAEAHDGDTILDVDSDWYSVLDRLQLRRREEYFGTLRWCIRLDHAVWDLDLPCEWRRMHFDVDVTLQTGLIRVAWKDMLIRFLKTERQYRLLLEQKTASPYTFSHHEDCLRSVRRTHLMRSLTDSKDDLRILWHMRLLPPLWASAPSPKHTPLSLTPTENDAMTTLLLLRRAASLTTSQLTYLHTLHSSYQTMESALRDLDETYSEFKSYMNMPGFQMNILLPAVIRNAKNIPRNPVAWSDELRSKIEGMVEKWRGQREVVERVRGLLESSNVAMAVPDDSFDELGSDF